MATQKKPKVEKWWKINQLNLRQEEFCQLYVNSDRELFWNWFQCYVQVYKPDQTKKNRKQTSYVWAAEILRNPKIIGRINELLEDWWLSDENVDKQLLFLISQFEDKNTKLWAIREYNKLRQRIIDRSETKLIFDVKGKSLKELDEIRKQILSSK
jgi:hypothetical protein